jgi:hypothetical protein
VPDSSDFRKPAGKPASKPNPSTTGESLSRRKVAPRPAPAAADATDIDNEFEAPAAALPPRVVKKKPSRPRAEDSERTRAEPESYPSEVLVPVVLILAGLAISCATSAMLRPEGVPTGLWIGIRMAIIAASTVITIGALFVAAALLDLSYGFFHTAILKVAAITLTQAWVGDLAERVPIPFFDWLLTFGITYAMFKFFFELDDFEAIASMFVVRLVHWLAVAVVLIAILGAVLGGADISVPIFDGAPEAAAPDEFPDDEVDPNLDEF